MKKVLFCIFILSVVFITAALYFLDKQYFLCPIRYKRDMIIRCDSRGEGFFATGRSGNRVHEGLDLSAPIGEFVLASRSGMVIAARQSRGMGNFVVIAHAGKIATIYGHLSKLYVSKGQFVRQGDVIGAVGKTGNANYRDIQPHLHFEVRKNSTPQDPLEYLE